MKNKYVGYLILGITIIFSLVIISFNFALKKIVETTCAHGNSCPMHTTVYTQEIIGYGLMGFLVLVAIFIIFFMKDEPPKVKNIEKLKNLNQNEKKIIDLLKLKEGSIYQSDLVKEAEMNKVKMTRVLDKLEGKGLIDRKRRGMTNIVILK